MTSTSVLSPCLLTAAIVLISACSDDKPVPSAAQTGIASTWTIFDQELALPIPAGVRSLMLDNVFAVVSVNDFEPRRFGPGEVFTTTYTLNPGESLNGTIEWFETLPGNIDLLLASYIFEETINEPFNLSVDSQSYVTAGLGFDIDNDGFSNLEERRADSNPLNLNDTPTETINVRINRMNPDDTKPIIDGNYDSVYTERAQFQDVNGEQLNIDNLMIDQGRLRDDGNTEFRWFAMHDTEFLYLFVLGESVELATPIRDSEAVWKDDAIDIFIDADNSKGSTYDGIDDRQIIIPLLTSPTDNTGSNTTTVTGGPNSAPLPPISFATCLCTSDQHTWEVRLPLDALGIELGRPFGLEVQLNEDNDGDERDAKWGWHHPSRTVVDVDNTFKDPSFMGTAVIN